MATPQTFATQPGLTISSENPCKTPIQFLAASLIIMSIVDMHQDFTTDDELVKQKSYMKWIRMAQDGCIAVIALFLLFRPNNSHVGFVCFLLLLVAMSKIPIFAMAAFPQLN